GASGRPHALRSFPTRRSSDLTMYSFPATILLTETGPNTFTPVGSLNSGVTIIPAANIASGAVSLPPGTGVVTDRDEYVRGHITSDRKSTRLNSSHVSISYAAF